MAWTITELDALKAAYAVGALQIKHGDKTVQYASGDDMLKRIRELERELNAGTSRARPRATAIRFSER